MTGPESERLAVLEHQYTTLQHDVTEIKADVKAIAAAQGTIAIALAVKEAATSQAFKDRSSTGVWIRSLVGPAIALVAVIIALLK
jgi:hypothetical protein